MTEAKHTPGPWTNHDGDITGIEDNGSGRGPVDVCSVYLRTVPGRHEANARLIASAPELLEALNAALATIDDYLDYEHNGDPWVEDARAMGEMDINDYKRDGRLEKARAAIAKATGQPHD